MKWIGQNIYDQISRFRNDVYLEDISTGTIASGAHLGLDSNNKIVKAADGGGDLTSIVAGTGLSGTSLTGPIPTLNVDAAQTQITSIGTIATGVWNGTAIASAYLDADTAHLTTDQTFTGDKTFSAPIVSDGNRTLAPGDGAAIHVDAFDVTDGTTSASGTAASFRHISIENPRLMATNSSVTTTDASTLYIKGAPAVSTNQTITNAYALFVDSGNVKIDSDLIVGGDIDLEGDIDVNGTLETDALTVGGTNVLTGSLITTLGTISAGVWQGTAVATDQQKHLANFEFEGFSVGDGTNYMIPEANSDTKAPFEHQTSTGSDGLTATAVISLLRTAGHVMPYAGTLKLWKGWATSSGSSQTVDVGLYKVTLVNNDADAVSPAVLKNTSFTSVGNSKALTFAETSFDIAFAAGDILISAVRNGTNAKRCDFASTLVVEWD